MQIRRHLTSGGNIALCIGNFDGCHLGHLALLRQTQQLAAAEGLPFAALTFEPHPLAVLRPALQVRRLGGMRDKIMRIAASGVDVLYLMRFDKQTAAITAESFCALLFDKLGARVVAVGDNFCFGKGRRGDVDMLRCIGGRYDAKVQTAKLLESGGAVVSSGRIRTAIEEGDFDKAESLLGHPWLISGKVVRGRGMGAGLGFPTANIHSGFVPPCCGIFAAMVYDNDDINKSKFRRAAAVSIGTNPTVRDDGTTSIEAHLPDFDGDLYRRRLVLRLCRKLRDEKHYASQSALKHAIGEDVRAVRQIFRQGSLYAKRQGKNGGGGGIMRD